MVRAGISNATNFTTKMKQSAYYSSNCFCGLKHKEATVEHNISHGEF